LNSKRSENDGAQKTESGHHRQDIEFQRQTHRMTSELLQIKRLPESGGLFKTKTLLRRIKSATL
jgi:hypothetical protein